MPTNRNIENASLPVRDVQTHKSPQGSTKLSKSPNAASSHRTAHRASVPAETRQTPPMLVQGRGMPNKHQGSKNPTRAMG